MTNYEKTESERELLLNKLSDNLILVGMMEQLESKDLPQRMTNFLQIFDDKFSYISIKHEDDQDLMDVINKIKLEFYIDLCNSISAKFDIETNFDLDIMPLQNFYFYVRKMYEFFVLEYRNNLITFFTKYIYENKSELLKVYKPITDKTDLSVGSIRKTASLDGTIIIYNLDKIIAGIPSVIHDNVFIIEEIINDEPDETANLVIHELFIDAKEESNLGINFVDKFFEPLFNEELKFSINVEIEARLLKLL
jgi:hypothetical protein